MLARNKQILFPESAMLTFITSSEPSDFSIRPIHSMILSYIWRRHNKFDNCKIIGENIEIIVIIVIDENNYNWPFYEQII